MAINRTANGEPRSVEYIDAPPGEGPQFKRAHSCRWAKRISDEKLVNLGMEEADVLVVGGGAAGLMCASEAGKRGRRVIVLERNKTIGEKIRISGGGRCNFTNLHTTFEHFITENPNFHKSALARYTPAAFIRLVEKHGIAYEERKHGQLFCVKTSADILALLRRECAAARVQIATGCRIDKVERGFIVHTNLGEFHGHSLVIASGGLSIPKLGASGFGYAVARQFGLAVTPLRPGLVPLRLDGAEAAPFRALSGVSLAARVRCGRTAFEENILFTHRGLSGPAILQISSHWREETPVVISPSGNPPRRFLQVWNTLPARPATSEWSVVPSGTEGYPRAEVTVGGVDTSELSSQTMEARRVPGLYFIGEVVDVTGHLGGFNFQWAWASGWAAGQRV
jgi:predicted flavoprotein YhiN